jgi:hypothetical protein
MNAVKGVKPWFDTFLPRPVGRIRWEFRVKGFASRGKDLPSSAFAEASVFI